MACARDGFSNAQIHSLETNGGRGTDTRGLVYSTSLFCPVLKRLVTITCSIQTPGGIVAKKLSTLRTTSAVSRANRASSKSAAVRHRPQPSRRHPSAPGDRAATSSSPSAAPIWTRAAGTSATSSTSAAMPTWTIRALAWPSSAASSTRTATKWASSASRLDDPASISVLGEPRLAFSSAPATWTPWSTTIR